MDDSTKSYLEGLIAQHEGQRARYEAQEEIITAVNILIERTEALERDLKWLLAIPRAFRALKQGFVRLIPYRRVRRFLAITAPTATVVGVVAGTVHNLYGWSRLIDWQAKIFTGQ